MTRDLKGSGQKKQLKRRKKNGVLIKPNFPKMKIVVKSTKTISFDENFNDESSSSADKSQDSNNKSKRSHSSSEQEDDHQQNF